ncbi:MAG: nitrogenase [Acaryochloris sp. RU_4_1]|nr:nitrogenase [Acaryochloris sp. RU_4_1]NJR53233.1 nitrogenase [Acaryochloris sp. CRU_2_0]
MQSAALNLTPNPSSYSPFKTFCKQLVRRYFATLDLENPKVAHRICKLIPAQCPFARDVMLFGHQLLHIPPLCKLNPAYDEFVELRFRALVFLADHCGEDVSQYC